MMEFMQKMWNPMGFPFPGMIAPTVDPQEIDRKLAEIRSVENWLRMNLAFIEMTVKTLEMQKSALDTLSGKATETRRDGSG
jgi:hypothetical protein